MTTAQPISREAGIGFLVLCLGLAVMLLLGLHREEQTRSVNDGLHLIGIFNQADGVGIGSEIRMGGVPVGQIVGHSLDDHYRAVLVFRLDDPTWMLPDDTAAKIETDGLLGAKYVELEPGGGFDTLSDGDTLFYTQDSVIVEDLLSKIVYLAKTRRGLDPTISLAQPDPVPTN